MKRLIKLSMILPLISYSKGHYPVTKKCTKDNAVYLVNKQYKRSGHKLENYIVEVKEDSLHYNVEYKLKEPARYGGGAKFTISKQDCSIVDQKLYQ